MKTLEYFDYEKIYCPCDECPYGIEKRDGSGNDSMCKKCEFAKLLEKFTSVK